MDTNCVIECNFETTIPVNGSCVTCSGETCAKHCTQAQIFNNAFPLMSSNAAEKMKTCEYYSGALYINKNCFRKNNDGVPLLRLDDLWKLRSIKEIVGYIYFDFTGAPEGLTNLTFLENLYKITVEFTGGTSLGIALSIYSAPNLEFLGFKSLRYIDTDTFFQELPSLCYTSGLKKIAQVRSKQIKSAKSCYKEGHRCHSECLPYTGCWGPGPKMCAHCCGVQAGGVCVSTCSDLPGYYRPEDIMIPGGVKTKHDSDSLIQCPTLPLTKLQQANMSEDEILAAVIPAQRCSRCHPECAETCTSSKNTDCVGGCKHVMESGACVKACSKNKFADEESLECHSCDPLCTKSLASSLLPANVNACSGFGYNLGRSGCTFCPFVKKDAETGLYMCLSNGCPPEHFGKLTHINELKIEQIYLSADNRHAGNLDIRECAECNPLCEVCTGPGTHESVCKKCRNWLYKAECVESCPHDDTYTPKVNQTDVSLTQEEKNAIASKLCLLCHRQCSGGCTSSGPMHCLNCRYRKILINEDTNQFLCNSSCPEDQPHTMPNTNLCLTKLQYDSIVGTANINRRNRFMIITCFSLLALLLLVIVGVIIYYKYKSKQDKIREALRSTYTNVSLSKSKINENQAISREPNMGRLEMIKSDDLIFIDKSIPLGTGAFGAVYKGKWKVPKHILDQYNLARNTHLDVAIKVLRSASANVSTKHNKDNAIDEKNNKYQNANTDSQSNAIARMNNASEPLEMLEEAKVMSSVMHENCLPLIGVCLSTQMQCLVSIFVELGSLDQYLRDHQYDLTSLTLLSWAKQIANGMAYLEKIGIIHRDLAARNVLVQSSDHVQITDFGLAKMLDRLDEDCVLIPSGRVPIRWLAIETLQIGVYSHKTDVWSYGVTLWEIFTFGKQPYENLETKCIKDHVLKGGRLTQPDICTLDAYMVMVKCWMEDWEARPTFLELTALFERFCQTPGRYLYIQGDACAMLTENPSSPAPWNDIPELSNMREKPDGSDFKSNIDSTDELMRYRLSSQTTPSTAEEMDEKQSLLPVRSRLGHSACSPDSASSGRSWMRNLSTSRATDSRVFQDFQEVKQPRSYYNTPSHPQQNNNNFIPTVEFTQPSMFSNRNQHIGGDRMSNSIHPILEISDAKMNNSQEDYLEPRDTTNDLQKINYSSIMRPQNYSEDASNKTNAISNPEYLDNLMEDQDYLQPKEDI